MCQQKTPVCFVVSWCTTMQLCRENNNVSAMFRTTFNTILWEDFYKEKEPIIKPAHAARRASGSSTNDSSTFWWQCSSLMPIETVFEVRVPEWWGSVVLLLAVSLSKLSLVQSKRKCCVLWRLWVWEKNKIGLKTVGQRRSNVGRAQLWRGRRYFF